MIDRWIGCLIDWFIDLLIANFVYCLCLLIYLMMYCLSMRKNRRGVSVCGWECDWCVSNFAAAAVIKIL